MDEVFELFDQPAERRQQSGREKEKDAKTTYHRFHGASRIPCYECVNKKGGVRTATVIRKEGQNQTYLCGRHAQERRDRETLDGNRA